MSVTHRVMNAAVRAWGGSKALVNGGPPVPSPDVPEVDRRARIVRYSVAL